jgi:hypothetical protein
MLVLLDVSDEVRLAERKKQCASLADNRLGEEGTTLVAPSSTNCPGNTVNVQRLSHLPPAQDGSLAKFSWRPLETEHIFVVFNISSLYYTLPIIPVEAGLRE